VACLSFGRTDAGPITGQTPVHPYSVNCANCSAKPQASSPSYKANSYSLAKRSVLKKKVVTIKGAQDELESATIIAQRKVQLHTTSKRELEVFRYLV